MQRAQKNLHPCSAPLDGLAYRQRGEVDISSYCKDKTKTPACNVRKGFNIGKRAFVFGLCLVFVSAEK